MSAPEHPLEPDRATQERWLAVFAGLGLDHMAALAAAPAVGSLGAAGAAIADEVGGPVPEDPLPGGAPRVAALLERALEASLVTPGPGYLAYVPGSGLFASALADLVAGCVNRFTGLAAAAPGPSRLENDVLTWLAREFGYDGDARGVLTSGGSLANLAAILTARERHFPGGGDFRRAIAYTASQAHHCIARALRFAGIPPDNVRVVPVDDSFRMLPAALADAVDRDAAAGLRPFLVVSSAGTTNTGAVDPLHAIADVCEARGLWHNVDAAYGGGFVLCEEGRAALSGIERGDSIVFDPHKGLFLPFGTGCVLVREGQSLRRAHGAGADYLQDFDRLDRSRETPSPTEYGPELSRSYRGLRIWLPLMLHGARAFRSALSEKLALARRFHAGLLDMIAAGAPVECVAPPQLSTTAFRLARLSGEPLDAWNARNARWIAAVNAREHVYLSSTLLPVDDGDAFTLRVCVLGFRTHSERIDACLDDLRATL